MERVVTATMETESAKNHQVSEKREAFNVINMEAGEEREE